MQLIISFVVVQLLIRLRLFATPCTAGRQSSCPSQSPGVCSNSCPLSQWCYPTMSCSVAPFSSFPESGSFSVSWLFASGGQSIGVSASAFSISPSNEYSGFISFRIDWLDLLAVQRTLKNLLQHHNLKASILWCFSLL